MELTQNIPVCSPSPVSNRLSQNLVFVVVVVAIAAAGSINGRPLIHRLEETLIPGNKIAHKLGWILP